MIDKADNINHLNDSYRSFEENGDPSQNNQFETLSSVNDSQHDIEEFSSFDISEDDQSSGINEKNTQMYLDDDDQQSQFSKSEAENNSDTDKHDIMSTPKSHHNAHDLKCFNSAGSDIKTQSSIKPSSRMSSDTFETPKTIDTRASTMTSNTPFDFHKSMDNELLFSGASIRRQPQKLQKVKEPPKTNRLKTVFQNNTTTSPAKRLSRQSDYDTSADPIDYTNMSFESHPVDIFFSKLSLDDVTDSKKLPHLVPNTTEILELQNQLTNCKIQIKLQNDLLRDKFSKSIGNNLNKQDLSDELERQIFKNINTTKNKLRLDSLTEEYNSLKSVNDDLILKSEDLIRTLDLLREQHSEQTSNQFEWQNKIKDIITKIKDKENFDSPKKITDFKDILNTLEMYIEKLLLKISAIQNNEDKSKNKIDEFTEEIKKYDDEKELLKKEYESKVAHLEETNFEYKKKILEYENLLATEKSKTSKFLLKNNQLEYEVQKHQDEKTSEQKKMTETRRNMKHLEIVINDLNIKSHKLEQLNVQLLENMKKIQFDSSSSHSVILNILMRVLDNESSSGILAVSKKLNNNDLTYDEFSKILSVLQNYEVQSLSTIVDNYESLAAENASGGNKTRIISELKCHISVLNKKIHDLENSQEKETVRISELETQNNKLREISNNANEGFEKLHKMRLDDLTDKWKAAEEALSQTKKGAKLKILELENEIKMLRAHLSNSNINN